VHSPTDCDLRFDAVPKSTEICARFPETERGSMNKGFHSPANP